MRQRYLPDPCNRFPAPIRITPDGKWISVIDVIKIINFTDEKNKLTQSAQKNASDYNQKLLRDVKFLCSIQRNYKFDGQGQRETPVAKRKHIIQIIQILKERKSRKFKQKIADLITICMKDCAPFVDDTNSLDEKMNQTTIRYVNASKLLCAEQKSWTNFLCAHSTQAMLSVVKDRLQLSMDKLIMSTGRCTDIFVHPEIGEHLLHWLGSSKDKLDSSGMVYAVTSPLHGAVKIGYWTGNIKALSTRYRTTLGKDIWIAYVKVNNAALIEKQIHTTFAKERLSHELFEKTHLQRYVTELKRYGTPEVYT